MQVDINENYITIIFTGHDNLLNAIYSRNDEDVTFINVTYWGADGITNTGSSAITPSRSRNEAGQNITASVVVNDEIVLNEVKVTDGNGMVVLIISAGENYFLSIRHEGDSYYTNAEKVISNMTFKINVASQTTHNMTVNITAKSNIYREFMKGELLFTFPNGENIAANYAGNGTWWALHTFGDYGNYSVNATCIEPDNVTITNATISITKTPTEILVENESVDLFVGDCVGTGATLTPADAGNLTFTSSDVSVVKVEDGKIVAVGEGTANITVSFAGSEDYATCENKTITVTVSKVPTEITALDISTVYNINKYLIVNLKDSNGKALGGVEVTVDLNGAKTYTTDSNGQVKVSTKGLSPKTYAARITFNGNTNYDKSAKNVKVTVKKAANPLKIKGKTLKVKFKKLKKKTQKLKVTKVVRFTKKGVGSLTYKKVKGNKKISINKKTGKITIKKSLKKGTYKVKVKIRAKGNKNYKASGYKTVTFKIKVK